jgi:hypothetical protein
MRTTDEEMARSESRDVVRLTIDGNRNAVNTIKEQQTGRGVSLVCPFPALEINIPVTLGKAGDLRRGSIHRIGVEDDPETGLPRLRLSIRTEEERETVVHDVSPSLVEGMIAARTRDIIVESTIQVDPELTQADQDDADSLEPSAEPAWIGSASFPLPDELEARSRTRRRYRIASTLVWTAIVSMLAGGVVALERAGVLDVNSLRSAIAGFSMDPPRQRSKSQIPASEALSDLALAKMESAEVEPVPAEPSPASMVDVAADEAAVQLASAEEGAMEQAVASEPIPETIVVEAPVAEAPAAGDPATPEDQTIVLPTRWPAEYVTAYRVREPNGIVVDVPGGLVKREGWLEIADQYPMVRSIKAVQRETGARFIVYTKGGELPRFVTDTQKNGVSLRLSWSASDDDQDRLAAL